MSKLEEDEIIKKMDGYYASKKMPVCTKCDSNANVIPCVFGKPGRELA